MGLGHGGRGDVMGVIKQKTLQEIFKAHVNKKPTKKTKRVYPLQIFYNIIDPQPRNFEKNIPDSHPWIANPCATNDPLPHQSYL